MELPIPRYKSNISVEETLFNRRSVRDYKDEPLTIEDVSQILWSAQGITAQSWGGRTTPSAGATYPLEIYLVVGNVKDLDKGTYHYIYQNHEIEKLNNRDIRRELATACWRQEFIATASIVIIIAAKYERTTDKYGKQGMRYVNNEVGHCGQNIFLQCEAMGLGTVVMGAFQESIVASNLKINEEPMYIMPVGKKKESIYNGERRMVLDIDLPNIKLFKKGKVRNIYEIGDKLLIVATDRISSFDIVLTDGIPNKGRVLTELSCFWFNFTSEIIKNHLITNDIAQYPTELKEYAKTLQYRSMLVKKTNPLRVECVVRGYLSGSSWQEYSTTGTISGIRLPSDLKQSAKLKEPIFTPSTKAETGHDQNISEFQMANIIGRDTTNIIKDTCLKIYDKASRYAESKGIIIADTKMEFGLFEGEVILIDELLTPDSSRFWDIAEYKIGISPPSFDKQFIRNYLERVHWNKRPPAPKLPDGVIKITQENYQVAYEKLLNKKL